MEGGDDGVGWPLRLGVELHFEAAGEGDPPSGARPGVMFAVAKDKSGSLLQFDSRSGGDHWRNEGEGSRGVRGGEFGP